MTFGAPSVKVLFHSNPEDTTSNSFYKSSLEAIAKSFGCLLEHVKVPQQASPEQRLPFTRVLADDVPVRVPEGLGSDASATQDGCIFGYNAFVITETIKSALEARKQPPTPVTATTTTTPPQGGASLSVQDRIKHLISSFPTMCFIKGSPEAPQCKFTRQLMALFAQHKITGFGHYNILEDEEMRSALKDFSQWPTFPQIYKDGEFVGGLDIVTEKLEKDGAL